MAGNMSGNGLHAIQDSPMQSELPSPSRFPHVPVTFSSRQTDGYAKEATSTACAHHGARRTMKAQQKNEEQENTQDRPRPARRDGPVRRGHRRPEHAAKGTNHEEQHLRPDHHRQPRLRRPGLRTARPRQGVLRPVQEGPQQVGPEQDGTDSFRARGPVVPARTTGPLPFFHDQNHPRTIANRADSARTGIPDSPHHPKKRRKPSQSRTHGNTNRNTPSPYRRKQHQSVRMGTPGKPRYTRIDANPANRVRLEILSSLHYTRTDANRTDYVRTGILSTPHYS